MNVNKCMYIVQTRLYSFTTTLHFPSGPIGFATLASLWVSSAQATPASFLSSVFMYIHCTYAVHQCSSLYVHCTYLSVHVTDMFILLTVCTWFILVHPGSLPWCMLSVLACTRLYLSDIPQFCISVMAMKTCKDNWLKHVCTLYIHVHKLYIRCSSLFILVCTLYILVCTCHRQVHPVDCLYMVHLGSSWFTALMYAICARLYLAVPPLNNAIVQESAIWYRQGSYRYVPPKNG